MTKPFAFITAAWPREDWARDRVAALYCRLVYKAGYHPLCPVITEDFYTNDALPCEHRDRRDFEKELLKRSRILVVCGDKVNRGMKEDIADAQRLHIPAVTLEGIRDASLCRSED